MAEMILVYTTCEDENEAKKIGKYLLKKRLAGCINIYPQMHSMFWWPPKKNKLDQTDEAVLVIKTMDYQFTALERAILEVHSYESPEIIALPVLFSNEKYLEWIKGETSFVEEGKVETSKSK